MIAHSVWKGSADYSLGRFVESIKEGILQKYQARMKQNDLREFFEQVHRYYMDYF